MICWCFLLGLPFCWGDSIQLVIRTNNGLKFTMPHLKHLKSLFLSQEFVVETKTVELKIGGQYPIL